MRDLGGPAQLARGARPGRRRHQRSSPVSTRQGARGSRNVAVPTCTASAPASSSSTASRPVVHPAHADDARLREGRPALPDRPHRHRVQRPAPRARRRPPRARGRRRSMSTARPSRVLTSVRASAPAPRAAPAISPRSATLGLSLAQRGSPHAAAATASAVAVGEWANMRERSSTLGQLTLTSTATTGPGDRTASASSAAAWANSSTRATPDADHHPGAGGRQLGQVVLEPGLTPGPLQPDAVEHPGRRPRAPGGRGCPARARPPAT